MMHLIHFLLSKLLQASLLKSNMPFYLLQVEILIIYIFRIHVYYFYSFSIYIILCFTCFGTLPLICVKLLSGGVELSLG